MVIMVLIVLLAIFLTLGNTKRGLKIKSNILIVIGIIILIIVGVTTISSKVNNNQDETTNNNMTGGFTIEKYKIVLDVSSSNVINVTQYITADFYENGHHGIMSFIPEWLKYTDKTGKTRSRKAKVSNITSTEEYSIDTVKGKQRILIGNDAKNVDIGLHEYQINYTYDMGPDPYKNFDELIFHAYGDFWATEIKNASLEIKLPKKVELNNKIHFFADKYRKRDITNQVNYYVIGNTIYASLSPNYTLNKALTVDIELPEGYFSDAKSSYGVISLTICLICILCAVISYFLWKKYGKDYDKEIETVEFYPPDKLDPAEIGYLYKKEGGKKLSIALIISLASKGYLKIIDSTKEGSINIKQKIIKSVITDLDEAIKREVKITKLKEPVDKEKESEIYNKLEKLFKGKQEVIIKQDFNLFYEESKDLVEKEYIRIEYDTINAYTNEAITNIKKKLEEKESKNLPKLSSNERIVYDRLFESSDEVDLSTNHTFYKAFRAVSKNIEEELDSKINDIPSYKMMLKCSVIFIVSAILWALAYALIKDMDPEFSIMYYIALVASLATLIFTCLMGRKTTYGEKIKAKINGFRNYIQVAEKDQIEALVEKDPKYFYNILPYAYVLYVSKKWIEKFENIPVPQNEMGNFDYNNITVFDNLSYSTYSPSSGSSIGGCSSCGGGCSSCGGGCSSCGGGGSW